LHSIFSRSAGLADWFIPTIADFVHLLLSGLWLGGVAMLSAVVVPVVQKNEALLPEFALFLKKFSALAMFCVMGLGLTGLAQASLFLSSFDDVFATSYGQALLLKVSLFAILIGFGAWHQQRILPRMVRKPKNDGRLMQHLQKTLWAETAISAVLLIVVTLMKVL
jgi:putative copper export protein